MAQFCTKCGSPLTEGVQFCTGCGAPTGQGASPFEAAPAPLSPAGGAASPVVPAPPAPAPAGYPPAPRPSSGSPVLKIILIVVLVLVFLGILSAGACVYFVYRTRQRIHQYQRQMNSSFPTTTTAPGSSPGSVAGIDASSLEYPGAVADNGASLTMGPIQVRQYLTSDPVDKVVDFYKQKLGTKAFVQEGAGSAVVQAGGSNGGFHITISPDSAQGKTRISITRIAK